MDGWMKEWMDELINAWMNELINAWMNELINEWIDEWMDGWKNKWKDEWMNEWTPVTHNTHRGTPANEVCRFVRFALPTGCCNIQNAAEKCISRRHFVWESRGLEIRVTDVVCHYDLSTWEAKTEICLRCTERYVVFQVQILSCPENYAINIRQLLTNCHRSAPAT
jgi:hypothetical protein